MFQIIFGRHPNVPQECARHFGEGAFDQVEPRTMLGRMNMLKSTGARGEVGHGFLRDVRRMVVKNHPDDCLWRVVGVDILEQRDELDTAVAILGAGKNVSRIQIDTVP